MFSALMEIKKTGISRLAQRFVCKSPENETPAFEPVLPDPDTSAVREQLPCRQSPDWSLGRHSSESSWAWLFIPASQAYLLRASGQ
ncbi:MAG: hypothetical protein WCY32_10890 [Burkholderiaceae bacterium]